jgi:NAD(P)-dependent dehydrogenase (short-subunit alcohol dehydrogenase family)
MKIDLTGKVALVTGAAGGIGKAVVASLLAAGAQVVAEDINPAVAALALPNRVATITGAVAVAQTAQAAVRLAETTFEGLDILINCAGRSLPRAFLETTEDEWDNLLADNVKGAFLHAQAAVPALILRGGGTIVNVSSISGEVGLPNLVAYCTSKGAVNLFTKSLALELAPHYIRVNAVAPGVVETSILDSLVANGRQSLRDSGAQAPLGRVGQPEEIARVILFLASAESSFMTGSVTIVDGGYTAE